MPSLKVTPQRILVDDTPIIKCSDLGRYQNVTLVSLLECPQRTYIAHAFYQANKDGNIFNTRTPSTGGTFTGKIIFILNLYIANVDTYHSLIFIIFSILVLLLKVLSLMDYFGLLMLLRTFAKLPD